MPDLTPPLRPSTRSVSEVKEMMSTMSPMQIATMIAAGCELLGIVETGQGQELVDVLQTKGAKALLLKERVGGMVEEGAGLFKGLLDLFD
jgi:hypothetical protein